MQFRYGNVVVITGGSSGIGLECAKMFAANGYTVFALSRHQDAGTINTGTGIIHTLPCDVCSDTSVESACNKIAAITGDIGIVIHSAGFGISGAAEDTDIEQVKQQIDTNYLGVLRVNKQLMPFMRKRGAGLVIVIGSVAGLISIPFQSHYSASKYAIEAYMEALRIESRSYGIRACIIEPGDTKTGFSNARVKSYLNGSSPYIHACKKSVAKMEKDEQNGKSPELIAKVALRVAYKQNPPIRIVAGIDYKLVVLLKKLLPSRLTEFIVAKLYS